MIPRLDSGSGGGGTDTTDDSTDSDTSTSDGSSSDYEYTYDNRYDADPAQAESGQPGGGDPAVDLTAPDPNENEDGDGVFVDEDGNTAYDPDLDPTAPDESAEEIVDRIADDDVLIGDDGTILNPANDAEQALPKTLRIEGGGIAGEYSFSVSGSVEHAGTPNPEDSVNGSSAQGSVYRGTDEYRFSGDLTNLSLPEAATAYVDGEEVAETGGLPDLSEMGGSVALPGVGEVPAAGLAIALLVVAAAVMEG